VGPDGPKYTGPVRVDGLTRTAWTPTVMGLAASSLPKRSQLFDADTRAELVHVNVLGDALQL
jgi:hypothetical protein